MSTYPILTLTSSQLSEFSRLLAAHIDPTADRFTDLERLPLGGGVYCDVRVSVTVHDHAEGGDRWHAPEWQVDYVACALDWAWSQFYTLDEYGDAVDYNLPRDQRHELEGRVERIAEAENRALQERRERRRAWRRRA